MSLLEPNIGSAPKKEAAFFRRVGDHVVQMMIDYDFDGILIDMTNLAFDDIRHWKEIHKKRKEYQESCKSDPNLTDYFGADSSSQNSDPQLKLQSSDGSQSQSNKALPTKPGSSDTVSRSTMDPAAELEPVISVSKDKSGPSGCANPTILADKNRAKRIKAKSHRAAKPCPRSKKNKSKNRKRSASTTAPESKIKPMDHLQGNHSVIENVIEHLRRGLYPPSWEPGCRKIMDPVTKLGLTAKQAQVRKLFKQAISKRNNDLEALQKYQEWQEAPVSERGTPPRKPKPVRSPAIKSLSVVPQDSASADSSPIKVPALIH